MENEEGNTTTEKDNTNEKTEGNQSSDISKGAGKYSALYCIMVIFMICTVWFSVYLDSEANVITDKFKIFNKQNQQSKIDDKPTQTTAPTAEPDFGPYMKKIQTTIKRNWEPPKGTKSNRVVVVFKIGKGGELLSVGVLKSSGLITVDKAAINAVKLAAPFDPLPTGFKGKSVDVQFTFDYNVFNNKKKQ